MKKNFILIFVISAGLSFGIGRLAGKMSAEKLETSMLEVLSALSSVEEIREINHPEQADVYTMPSYGVDPNL